MTIKTLPILFGLFTLAGCPATDKDDTAVTDDTADADTDTDADSDTDADTDTDTDTDTVSYTVTGTAIDFATQTPAPEGLCLVAVDPGPAITGGDPTVLGSTTVGAKGAFSVGPLTEKPSLGLVLIVQDCAAEGTVYPTGTGIKAGVVAALESGATLSDQNAFSINVGLEDALVSSFAAAGGSWDPATEGVLLGFVFDGSTGAPISGATVSGTASTTYYWDTNPKDGLFTSTGETGLEVNSKTDSSVGAVWAIPAAPITSYTATADGYTFEALTGGSLPGIALFVAFFGTPA